jgi:hypothetical protein
VVPTRRTSAAGPETTTQEDQMPKPTKSRKSTSGNRMKDLKVGKAKADKVKAGLMFSKVGDRKVKKY